MEHGEISLQPLLIVMFLALAVPFLLHRIRRFRIPVVVGEIIAGIIVGRSGFGLIKDDPWLEFFSLLGFTYLMFLGGAEIDIDKIMGGGSPDGGKRKGGSPLLLSIVFLIGTLALSLFAVFLFIKSGVVSGSTQPLMLALIICTTSVGVILPTLKETGMMSGAYGQTILVAATIVDIVTIVIATVALVLLSPGSGAMELASFAGLCAAFLVLFYIGAKFSGNPVVKRIYEELSHTSAQLKVRTAFALMLLFAFLSQEVGVELILGAFMAGLMFSMFFRGGSNTSLEKFDAIGYGFLLPVFFIMVGANLDLSIIFKNPDAVLVFAALLAAAFAVKLIPALIFAPWHGARNSLAAGFLLTGQLSLTIAFAQVAVSKGLLDPSFQAVAVMLALATCTLAPVSFFAIWRKRPGADRMGVVIMGAGKVGRRFAARLIERGHAARLLDIDIDAVKKARLASIETFHIEKFDRASMEKAGMGNADIFVAVTNDDMANMQACISAREEFGIINLVARAGNPANETVFVEHGIKPMNTTESAVISLENIVFRPSMYGVFSSSEATASIVEVVVGNSAVAGKKLASLNLPGNSLVAVINRGGITSVPYGGTVLEPGDIVTVLVSGESEEAVRRFFSGHG